jgi:hypothetical protein
MTPAIKAAILGLIGVFLIAAAYFVVDALKDLGAAEVVLKQEQVAKKTVAIEKKNAEGNAQTAKKTAVAKAADKAKAEVILKEIEDAAKKNVSAPAADGAVPSGVVADPAACRVLTADELRRYNDPLGDAPVRAERGVPDRVPAQPAVGS